MGRHKTESQLVFFKGTSIREGSMKQLNIITLLLVFSIFITYLGCEDSGSGDGKLAGTATASSQPSEIGNLYV